MKFSDDDHAAIVKIKGTVSAIAMLDKQLYGAGLRAGLERAAKWHEVEAQKCRDSSIVHDFHMIDARAIRALLDKD